MSQLLYRNVTFAACSLDLFVGSKAISQSDVVNLSGFYYILIDALLTF